MKKYLIIFLIVLLPLNVFAVVSGTNLDANVDIDGNSTAVTASISPAPNALILLTVTARTNISVDTNQPTVTGNGLTWVLVNDILFDTTSSSRKRVSVFRAMGSAPTTGSATIDYGGQAQTNINYSVDQFKGVNTKGTNGSEAIVQSVVAKDESATTNTITATLGAFSSPNNATFGGFGTDGGGAGSTVGSGFTALGSVQTANVLYLLSEWNPGNDTTVDASWTGNRMMGVVAMEIAVAPQNSPTVTVNGQVNLNGQVIIQ